MSTCTGVPLPIVKLNRWTLLAGVLLAVLLKQPLITTGLFLILLPTVLFGQKASLIFKIGTYLPAAKVPTVEREDQHLQRFNNSIATLLLGGAQVAFLLGQTTLAWALSLVVATAAAIALLGFCVGCFLYFQFKLNRYRLLGR